MAVAVRVTKYRSTLAVADELLGDILIGRPDAYDRQTCRTDRWIDHEGAPREIPRPCFVHTRWSRRCDPGTRWLSFDPAA